MEAYKGFASLYDIFMDNIPYEAWSDYLTKLLKEYGINDGLVLDLGCGTGNITELLARAGYDMIGIDLSEDMLNVALDKKYDNELDILYLNQDMREFELYGTVSAIVSICDSINYITDYDDLVQVFKLVNNYLDPKGLFIFDMNTIYKYASIGEATIAENRPCGSFIWENYYDKVTHINEYDLTIYAAVDSEDKSTLYERYEESHTQRGYTLDEIIGALEAAGLEYITSYDAFTKEPVQATSERMYIIAREQGK